MASEEIFKLIKPLFFHDKKSSSFPPHLFNILETGALVSLSASLSHFIE